MKPRAVIASFLRHVANVFEGAVYRQGRSYVQQATQGARFDVSASSRTELLRKSRYFEQNSWLLNRLADLFESYTVGTGLQVTPISADPVYNSNAKEWWDEWSLYPDLTSRQTLGTLESLIARAWFIDGEVFVILTRGESGRPRLQLVEAHRVRTPPGFAQDPSVVDGIKLDVTGRPLAYFIGTEIKPGQLTFGPPTPADFVIHVFEPGRPGQLRGLPFVYPVLNVLHDLDDLGLLEMKAARANAATSKVIKTDSGELDAETFVRNGGSLSQGTDQRATYIKESLGDDAIVLRNGDSYEEFAPSRPNVTTMEYWESLQEAVCNGVGIPHVLVCPDSMQGTTYRGTLDLADAWFRARSAIVQDAVRRIFGYVMSWANFNVPTLADPPADWRRLAIYPPRSVNVDIGRNSSAMLAELAAGTVSYDMVYGPRGLDWRQQFDALAEQQRYAEQIGLKLTVGQIVSTDPPSNPALLAQPDGELALDD